MRSQATIETTQVVQLSQCRGATVDCSQSSTSSGLVHAGSCSSESSSVGGTQRRRHRRRTGAATQPRRAAGQQVAEGDAEVAVEQRVDARIDPGRHVSEPREGGEQIRRHGVTTANAVRQVSAEERQPERDERSEHPDQGLLGSTLSTVDLRRASARRQHVEVDHRFGPRPSATADERRLGRRRLLTGGGGGGTFVVAAADCPATSRRRIDDFDESRRARDEHFDRWRRYADGRRSGPPRRDFRTTAGVVVVFVVPRAAAAVRERPRPRRLHDRGGRHRRRRRKPCDVLAQYLDGPEVGDDHHGERNEEWDERRVDGERSVEYAARQQVGVAATQGR